MEITPTKIIYSPIFVDKKIATTDNYLASSDENIANTYSIFANTDDIFTNLDENLANTDGIFITTLQRKNSPTQMIFSPTHRNAASCYK